MNCRTDHRAAAALTEDECLNAYLDGELPHAARRALQLRVLGDDAMRARLAELARVRSLVRLAYEAERQDEPPR